MNATDIAPADSRGLRATRNRSLRDFFAPDTVAIVGASQKPGSVGRALMENLRDFEGRVFPINPNHTLTIYESTSSGNLLEFPDCDVTILIH